MTLTNERSTKNPLFDVKNTQHLGQNQISLSLELTFVYLLVFDIFRQYIGDLNSQLVWYSNG